MNAHLVLTGNVHPLNTLVDRYTGPISIARIQSTAHMVAFDSNMKRIYVIQMQDPTVTERVELDGNWNSDIVKCSCIVLDGTDPEDAVTLYVTVDDSGYYIYALVYSASEKLIYVKTFEFNNIQSTITPWSMRITLPTDDTPIKIPFGSDTVSINVGNHPGTPAPSEGYMPGAGMAWIHGRLYVLMQREIDLIATFRDFDYILCRSGSMEVLHQFGIEEERSGKFWFVNITVIDPYTGELYGTYKLSEAGIDTNGNEYSFYQGMTFTDDHIFMGKHWDTRSITANTLRWHLIRGKYVDTMTSDPGLTIVGSLMQEYCGAAHGQTLPILMDGSNSSVHPQIFKSQNVADISGRIARMRQLRASAQARMSQSAPVTETRGHPEIMKIPLSEFSGGNKSSPEFKTITNQIFEYGIFPFEVAIPYSLTADRGSRKMYFAMGASMWTFDMIGFTLISDHGVGHHLGDIIDFNEVEEGTASDILVYFRNDEPWTMYNVELWLPFYVDGSERWADVFLLKNATDEGFKSVALGHVGPGESVSFVVRVYALRVNDSETGKEHRLPLRVQWSWVA